MDFDNEFMYEFLIYTKYPLTSIRLFPLSKWECRLMLYTPTQESGYEQGVVCE